MQQFAVLGLSELAPNCRQKHNGLEDGIADMILSTRHDPQYIYVGESRGHSASLSYLTRYRSTRVNTTYMQ